MAKRQDGSTVLCYTAEMCVKLGLLCVCLCVCVLLIQSLDAMT